MIIVDIHEPNEIKETANETIDLGYDILVTGDTKSYFIERKTISDFISSIYSKRIFYQLDRIKEMCDTDNKFPILLLEGSTYNLEKRKYGKMKLEMFYGVITAIQEKGINIIHTNSIVETKRVIKMLDKRCGKNDDKIIYTNKSTIKTDDERYKFLCALPGIGYKTAKKLLDKYNNIYAIMNLSEEEWKKEIGNKKGTKIHNIIKL